MPGRKDVRIDKDQPARRSHPTPAFSCGGPVFLHPKLILCYPSLDSFLAEEGQMRSCLRRREFIAGLGDAAVWPLAARAQHRERMRRIGELMPWPGFASYEASLASEWIESPLFRR
jgi:hypothetical protein